MVPMRSRWPITLVLATSLAAGCGKKKQEASVEPEAEGPPAPEEFAPPEEDPAETPTAVDPYEGMSDEEREAKAKELYVEAEGLAKSKDWENAELKYEEAYYLVPGKHGFAFKVGTAAFEAGHCQKAEQYLNHFKTYADPKKQAARLDEAKKILGKTAGCTGGE